MLRPRSMCVLLWSVRWWCCCRARARMFSGLFCFGLLVFFLWFGLSRPCLSVLCWLAANQVEKWPSSLFLTSLDVSSLLLTLLLAEFLLSYPVYGVLSGLPSLLFVSCLSFLSCVLSFPLHCLIGAILILCEFSFAHPSFWLGSFWLTLVLSRSCCFASFSPFFLPLSILLSLSLSLSVSLSLSLSLSSP